MKISKRSNQGSTQVIGIRAIALVFFLWLSVMASGLAVVYSTHTSRQLLNELETKRRIANDLQVNRNRYLLEYNALAEYNRVQDQAQRHLGMVMPTPGEFIIVER